MTKGVLAWLGLTMMAVAAAAQTVTGSGTTNTVPVFTGTSTVGNSPITVSGSNVGIGTTNVVAPLTVAGNSELFDGSNKIYGNNDSVNYYLGHYPVSGSDGLDIHWYGGVRIGDSVGPVIQVTGGSVGVGTTTPTKILEVNVPHVMNQDNEIRIGSYSSSSPSSFHGIALEYTISSPNGTPGSQISTYAFSAKYVPVVFPWGTSNAIFNGNVGIGTTAPGAKLEVSGSIKLSANSGGSITFQDGTTQSTAYTGVTCGGDYAESVDVTGTQAAYAPGDLLVINKHDPSKFVKSNEPYSTMVAGIYSTKPGTVGRRQTTPKSSDEVPMAVVGIVPAKVSAENGAIEAGDLLVSSSTPGVAMKGTDRNRMLGAVVGKAMGTLDSGTGTIEVLVTLQ